MNKKGFIFSFFLFLFSFCFIGSVKAINVNYHGITINDNMINNIWNQLEGKTNAEYPNMTYNLYHVYHRTDYPYLSITKKRNNNNLLYFTFLHNVANPASTETDTRLNGLNAGYPYGTYYWYDYWNPYGSCHGCYSYITIIYNINNNTIDGYELSGQDRIINNVWWAYNSYSNHQFEPSITSFDISASGNSITKSFDYTPSDSFFSINFHLNGGSVFDLYDLLDPITYTEDFTKYLYSNSINDYLSSITPYKNNYTFNGWYLDSNFTEPFDSESVINFESPGSTDSVNLFNKNTTTDGVEFTTQGNTQQNNDWYISDYIRVIPNENYIISGKTKGNAFVFYDSNKNKIIQSGNGVNGTITIPNNSDIYYIRFNGTIDEKDSFSFELENSNSNQTSEINLYAKWDINKWTFNFHLDGGSIFDRITDEANYSDFSITLYKNEIADFLSNSLFRHNYKGFESLYFDDSYLHKFTGTEDIGTLNSYSYSSNDEKYIDIYVKWYFLNVHDFLNHTNFTKYSFDTNYDYAVLSRGSNSSQMFLGLDFLVSNLPIYLYDSINDEILFSDSDGLMDHCSLSPDYVYDQRYYYELEVNCFDSISSSSYEILILPKSFFERAGVIGSYDFYLTDNVHLTYTNDLSNMTIYDKNDNSFTTDIDNVAGYPDSSVNVNDDLTSNFKSSLDYFLKPIKFIVKTITDLFNKYLNSSLRSYFYLVFVLIIAFFIIRIFF